ncbi:metal ABC transporter solute-binding protein, Zn/Mn family [Bifidobacterium gallicum]|uniref:ABC transporter substrate-binding protein n=1 Tax=Bifidobacterium gallicum DSM 20093 = LMG 11596 TaxID=561180 RepID=D1NVI2_9BIFI|nr:zinc ABC transporter substrate-binding protein [Bifidobacterium gallicum]EFA22833.1 ABC transporter, substrate-binding protein [Bifidobacterium gallicum DSM 20093 = LMG 11596]KFI59760.1 ABC transporter substrate-binding protein [Bifidobacterium gallicum DSM 20093 = LMG 11596]
MKHTMRAITAAIAAITLLAGASACGSGSQSSNHASSKNDVINVVAVSNQWGALAKDLGGDHVNVTTILNNTSTDAHDYEPTTNDIVKIENAQIAIVNGAGYDEWAVKAAKNCKGDVINAAEEGGKKTGDNPHVWFSAQVRQKTADALTAEYEKLDPANKADFEKLHEDWQNEENELTLAVAEVAKDDHNNTYAAVESVGDYLAEQMGLTDKTPQGYKQAAANESEPTASDLNEFETMLKNGDVDMLITNSQEPSAMSDRLIAAADSGNVPVVDLTEQMPSQYKNMETWLKDVVKQMQQAQSGK